MACLENYNFSNIYSPSKKSSMMTRPVYFGIFIIIFGNNSQNHVLKFLE